MQDYLNEILFGIFTFFGVAIILSAVLSLILPLTNNVPFLLSVTIALCTAWGQVSRNTFEWFKRFVEDI